MEHPVVRVTWDDAWSGNTAHQLSDLEDSTPVRTNTVGYLVHTNEHGLVLVTDLYPDTPEEGHTPMFIPHGMVVSTHVFHGSPVCQ